MSTSLFPGSLDAFTNKVDGVDSILASHMNKVQDAIAAVQLNIGTSLKGSVADLSTRLSVSLNADGTLKPGAVAPDTQALTIWNATGSTLTAGQLVVVSGWNTANGLAQVSLAVNNTANSNATYVVPASIANGAAGPVRRHWTSTANLNTAAASAVGAPVYLDAVAGGWTLTAPNGTGQRQQIVGRVIVKDAAVGQVEFDLISNSGTVISTNDLPADVALKDAANVFTQAQTVTAPAAGRCLTLNADTGTTLFVQPKAATNFFALKVNGAFQIDSDVGMTGSNTWQLQSLTTGQIWLFNDGSDNVTLGSPSTGGATLGASGGKASLYGVTPLVQQAQTVDLKTALVNFGLLASAAGATPLNLGGGHLATSGGTAPGAAAGTNAGTSPPVPVVTAGDNDSRGGITFGTGTTPAAGSMAAVTFAAAYASAPTVLIVPGNAATAALLPYVTAVGTGGFTLAVQVAPAASQANTVYSFYYHVLG